MSKNILVVGSKGRMGAYFLRKLQKLSKTKNEYSAWGIDVPLTEERMWLCCKDVDLVILCVPASAIASVLQLMVPHLQTHCIISDITSVKEYPLEQIHKYWQGAVVGTHPLFGNKSPRGSDLPVAIVETASSTEAALNFVENLFTELSFRVFRCTASQHDKAMAAIQNLNFITSLAYFAALAHDEDLLPFLTPSFKRRQDAAQKLLTEDAPLFAGLYEANPHSQQLVRKYISFLNIAAGGDIDLLAERAAWWWE